MVHMKMRQLTCAKKKKETTPGLHTHKVHTFFRNCKVTEKGKKRKEKWGEGGYLRTTLSISLTWMSDSLSLSSSTWSTMSRISS